MNTWPPEAGTRHADGHDVAAVGPAPRDMDGVYVDLSTTGLSPERWCVMGVTPETRRAAGQWPSGESLIQQTH